MKRPSLKAIFVISLLLGVSLLLFVFIKKSSTNKPISAQQLSREYQMNEAKAHATFDGRTILVTGTVFAIGHDLGGATLIEFDTGQERRFRVWCSLPQDDDLHGIRKGDILTAHGTPSFAGNIALLDCTIIER